jgi:ATP-dependent RNA helicase RhlE
MFSATMPHEIRRLADEWLRDPVSISVTPQATTADRVEQSVYFVDHRVKPQLLAHYLREQVAQRTLVFTRTKHGADKLVKILVKSGIRAEAIHGNKSQNARQRALAQFKSQHPPVLVATDIAARGLDVDGVSHVVNFDLPMTAEIYVHRIGRTARAGAEGIAVTFCDREERSMLREIERLTRQRLTIAQTDLAGIEPLAQEPDDDRRPRHDQQRRFGGGGRPGSRSGSGLNGRSRFAAAGRSSGQASSAARPPRPQVKKQRRFSRV